MNELNFLTVDLFLYDLCDALGRDTKKVEEIRQQFWQRLYPDLNGRKPTNVKETTAYFADYVELLDKRYKKLSDKVDGYYYPVQLGDTYALLVDSSGEKASPQSVNSPKAVNAISTDILQNHIDRKRGNLGESWLIWGQLTDSTQDVEATAKACYYALPSEQKPNWDQDQNPLGKGTFCGATLYELQQLDTYLDGKNNSHHVLICLFPSEQNQTQIKETIGKLHRHLIRLFLYRSKVMWLYEWSRHLKSSLKEASEKLDHSGFALSASVKAPKINLKELQQQLSSALINSNNYKQRLGFLREKEPEISTNLISYCDRLARMKITDDQADLAFLNHFVTLTKDKYLRQIQADTAAFESALKTLDSFIQTVQGITDIERTHNERVLNQTVAIAGVGISVASLAASSLSNQADAIIQSWRPIPKGQPPSVLNLSLSAALIFFVSIAIGGLAALITSAFISKTKSSS